MTYTISNHKFWSCLQDNFLYRTHRARLRKADKILMAVAIGALVLAGHYALFPNNVMPKLPQRIKEMFNYAG